MNLQRYKSLGLQFLLLNHFLLFNSYSPKQALANEGLTPPSQEYIRRIPSNNFYILGPGDVLTLKVKDEETSELNMQFSINGEGIANLKRLKRIYASGLTIGELTDILNKEYSNYVKEPDVELFLDGYRPVKFLIDGEVEEPGLHVLPGSSSPLEATENFISTETGIGVNPSKSGSVSSQGITSLNNIFFPSIIDAIRKSGGVTMYADLTTIKVSRVNSISNGSGRIDTQINLLDTLDLKDNSQNVRILDGDTILISRNEVPVISQISKAIKSNMNPKFINVYIAGRVENPGTKTISKSSVLTEAIEISGGQKVLRGPVIFLRYNNDGTIDRRKFSLRKSAPRGSYRNPFMKNGDVIYIGKGMFNVTNEVLTEIAAPFQSLFTTYGFFKILND